MFLISQFYSSLPRLSKTSFVAIATRIIVLASKSKTLQSAQASETKLSKVLPITQKRMQSSHKLLDRNLISEEQFLQIKQNFIEQTQDLKIESLRIKVFMHSSNKCNRNKPPYVATPNKP